MATTCNHVYTRGEHQGERCRTMVRTDASYCARHRPNKSATAVAVATQPGIPPTVEPLVDATKVDTTPSSSVDPPPPGDTPRVDSTAPTAVEPPILSPPPVDDAPAPVHRVEPPLPLAHHGPIQPYPAAHPLEPDPTVALTDDACDVIGYMRLMEHLFQANAVVVG